MAKENLTREQVRERYLTYEKEGRFNDHVDPIDFSIAMPVNSSFHYFPITLREKIKNWAIMNFGLKQFMDKVVNRYQEVEVVGQENLVGIKKAIVISNHVQMFDCITIKHAMGEHYTHVVAASFNNMKGKLGDSMRASGMMPLPNDFHDMVYFEKALEKALNLNRYVLIYPEQSEWWYYEKPRPFKDGAFYYAAKFNVPVISCFITYKPRKEKDVTPDGMYPYGMIVHIMKPIYPKAELSFKENRDIMRESAFNLLKDCYESTYHKPLEYK